MPAASNSSANSSVEAEVNSEGLMMAALPAARAVASLCVSSRSGEFHGVISATMPSGSCRVKVNMLGLPVGITTPSILSARPP